MILGFSTHINGKETFFVEKIQTALRLPYFKDSVGFSEQHVPPRMNFYVKSKCKPKLHTIRDDINNRWKVGNKIDFFINVRKKDMFPFAPKIPVISIQEIELKYIFRDVIGSTISIKIDNRELDYSECVDLAMNDGFDTIKGFFDYFDKDFKGKIIHWTDLSY